MKFPYESALFGLGNIMTPSKKQMSSTPTIDSQGRTVSFGESKNWWFVDVQGNPSYPPPKLPPPGIRG